MTTQNTQITTGNPSMSKVFTHNSTDDVWSGNVLLDSIAGQSIGILIPGSTLTFAQAEYEAGLMAWRLQNAQSLRVTARGWGVKAGQNCMSEAGISPVRVAPNDILTVYPLAVGSSTGKSNVLAWVTTTKGTELFKGLDISNNIARPLVTAVNSQSLGDAFFNSTLQSISVQCQDGCTLDSIQIVDEMGGVVFTAQGNVRGATSAAGKSNEYNLELPRLSIPIGKGWAFKVITVSV
jgi:hypothetical protein